MGQVRGPVKLETTDKKKYFLLAEIIRVIDSLTYIVLVHIYTFIFIV